MAGLKLAAPFAATLLLVSAAAHADSSFIYSPEALDAPVYGDADVVVQIAPIGETRAQTLPAVEAATYAGAITQGTPLDMTGADGSLRACYAQGGIAKQLEDFSYICNFETETVSVVEETQESAFILPPDAHSDYEGTTNIVDETLVDCVSRGGTLIQLAGNQQFACAM